MFLKILDNKIENWKFCVLFVEIRFLGNIMVCRVVMVVGDFLSGVFVVVWSMFVRKMEIVW